MRYLSRIGVRSFFGRTGKQSMVLAVEFNNTLADMAIFSPRAGSDRREQTLPSAVLLGPCL